jgi:prepilin-type N-terminal cleavage/methylation domain-containing protein
MIKNKTTIKGRLRNSKGFTMIEIIAVLVVLSIVTAMVISRGIATEEVKWQAEMDTMKGHLRFAQYRAMNDLPGIKWGINVAGASYTLVRMDTSDNTTTNPLYLPGESSATHTFAGGVTATVTGNNPILFDEWGSQGIMAETVSLGSKNITITASTGFIP